MIFFNNFHPKDDILSYNHTRYKTGQQRGHYESFFIRANHPTESLAFWIRYTIFSPYKNPENAIGEVWAVLFDGKSNNHQIGKSEFPITECSFDRRSFDVTIGSSTINQSSATGEANSNGENIQWNLTYNGDASPLYLFPRPYYHLPLPKAKALVGLPFAKFNGSIEIGNTTVDINEWIGSQNHNWGSEHTDQYAWGQIAGFDNFPNSFLEIATATIKIGWVNAPKLTILVLRHNGNEFLFNKLKQSIKNKGSYQYFKWTFSASNGKEKVDGTIEATKEDMVGLTYYNPPGGEKCCLNTKIASARIILTDQNGKKEKLLTNTRAAFEILTNKDDHGIMIYQPEKTKR